LETIKICTILLPYAPLATEISKDAANEAIHQMTSEGALLHRPSSEMEESERASVDQRSDHSTKNPFINWG
jgi:membrane protein required for colicin V production